MVGLRPMEQRRGREQSVTVDFSVDFCETHVADGLIDTEWIVGTDLVIGTCWVFGADLIIQAFTSAATLFSVSPTDLLAHMESSTLASPTDPLTLGLSALSEVIAAENKKLQVGRAKIQAMMADREGDRFFDQRIAKREQAQTFDMSTPERVEDHDEHGISVPGGEFWKSARSAVRHRCR